MTVAKRAFSTVARTVVSMVGPLVDLLVDMSDGRMVEMMVFQ